jgi:hypothetical protein
MRFVGLSLVLALAAAPKLSLAQDWSLGAYAGKYYDTEPAGFLEGRAGFVDQHLFALTATKTVWRHATLPLSMELDGMVGVQSGVASLGEVALAPALRWSGFPWNNAVHTSVSFAPFGVSYTTSVSPLERGPTGKGSEVLNWLFLEVALSRPKDKSVEFFARLHHRCTVYDLINNYGANGEDFFTLGVRRRF